jgi:hypothetical protein
MMLSELGAEVIEVEMPDKGGRRGAPTILSPARSLRNSETSSPVPPPSAATAPRMRRRDLHPCGFFKKAGPTGPWIKMDPILFIDIRTNQSYLYRKLTVSPVTSDIGLQMYIFRHTQGFGEDEEMKF